MYNLVKKNNIKILVSLISVMVLFVGLTFFVRKGSNSLTERQRRLMNYDQVQPGDENITGTTDIKFDAFFLEDLDNDGNAESIRGNSIEIGEKGELYLELQILGDVRLTNGQIKFVNSNARVAGTVTKGSLVSENQVSNNFATIPLKELNNGTSTLTKLTVNANLTNDLKSYSGINKVILTGTVTDLYGNEITDIEKEVPYTVDWYGDQLNTRLETKVVEAKTYGHTPTVKYTITSQETKGQLFLKQAYLEATISNLTGVGIDLEPVSVTISDSNVEYNYDPATHKLTATRKAVLNDTLITTQAYSYKNELISYNDWNITVKYADSDTMEDASGNISATVWYDAFNNQGTGYDNVKTSNKASKVTTAKIRTNGYGTVNMWDQVNSVYISPINKIKAMNLYNGADLEEPADEYNVSWEVHVPSHINDNNKGGNTYSYVISDSNGEMFNNELSIKQYVTYKTIKLEGLDNVLNPTGSAVIINNDTNETIHVFTALDWNTPYTFDDEVRSISIRLNGFKQKAFGYSLGPCNGGYCNFRHQLSFNVISTKVIDNEAIVDNISFDDYDTYGTITSKITAQSYKENNMYQTDVNIGSATYKGLTSDVYISSDKSQIYTTEETDVEFTVRTNSIDELASGFKNGEFYIVFPSDILDVKLNDVINTDPDLTIALQETGKLNDGRKYIRINTTNADAKRITFKLATTIIPNPLNMGSTAKVELYAYNPECHNYVNKKVDIYDINNNNDTNEKVAYSSVNVNLTAPNEVITTSSLLEYNNQNNVSVAPMIAEVNPVEDDPEATVRIGIVNNSEFTAKNVRIIGKVAYDDNTYQIGNGSLGSKYDVHMTDDGISYPAELDGFITIYYSEQETPTDDLNDAANGWKTKDATDFTKVKTYMIMLNDYDMEIGKSLNFDYDIEMPMTTQNLNKVTYFTHGVYYDLVTSAGLHPSQVGGSKLGIRMSRQYDIELTDLRAYSTKTISGTKYLLEDEDGNQKVVATDINGKLTIKDLYVDKDYTLKQISINDPFVIDNEVKSFKLTNGANDVIGLTSTGTLKKIELTNNKKITIEQENETRYDLVLKNTDLDTNEDLALSKFKITGAGYEAGKTVRTKADGTVKLNNLYLNEVYEVEQISVNNHMLTDKFNIKLVRDNDGTIKTIVDKKPTISDPYALNNVSSYTNNNGIININSDYNSNIFVAIPVDLTGLSKNYKATFEASFNAYNGVNDYTYIYAVEGDCTDTIDSGIYSYWFSSNSYVSGRSVTANTANFKFVSGNGYYSDNFKGGKKYCIKMSRNSYAGTHRVKNLTITPEDGITETANVGNIVDLPTRENKNATQTLTDDNSNTPVLIVSVKNKKIPTYTLEINKVDAETDEPLAGAQYKITGPGLPDSGKYLTTDANGKASIELNMKYTPRYSNSPWTINGNKYDYDSEYTIVEVSAPVGYTLDNKSITFAGNRTINVDSYNYNSATGAYDYTVDFSTGNHPYGMVYNATSEAKFKDITWDEVNQTFIVKLKDYPLVKLVKKDGETGNVLPNTLFAIYKTEQVNGTEVLTPATDANGQIIGEKIVLNNKEYYVVETDENGKINFNLGAGTYKIKEVQAADEKYELSDQEYYFGIGETVPYRKTPAKISDFIEINGFGINDSYSGVGYTTTQDGGVVVSGFDSSNKPRLIKYDSDWNVVWNVDNDTHALNGIHNYYYEGNLIKTEGPYSYTSSGGSQIFEAPDGSLFVSKKYNYFNFAKYSVDGELLWENKEINYYNEYEYKGICSISENLNSEGKVPLTFNYGYGDNVNYYTPEELNNYYSTFVIDSDHYYCGYNKLGQYNDFYSLSLPLKIVPTADGGAFVEVGTQNSGTNNRFIVKSVSGAQFEVVANGYSEALFLKFNSEGYITGVYNIYELIRQADQDYMTKYGLTSSPLYVSNPYNSIYDRHFVGTFKNGDILIVAGYNSGTFAIRLRYNEQEDKFDTIFYTPIGVNGWKFQYTGYDSTYTIPVQINDDDSFTLIDDHTLGLYGSSRTDYYNTELQQFDDRMLYTLSSTNVGMTANTVLEFDGTGKLKNMLILTHQGRDNSFNEIDPVDYDTMNYIYGYTNPSYRKISSGNTIFSGRFYANYCDDSQYLNHPDCYVRLANGELKRISNVPESYIIAEINPNNRVEWVKTLSGARTSINHLYMETKDGKYVLIPISTTANEIVDLETGQSISVESGKNGLLILELSNEIQPSGPEAYSLDIENNRKEYKITATSNVGGEITVTNPDNGQTVITTDGSSATVLERVKYGDDNKYDITINPGSGYSITSVKVNGKDASYKVNNDGSVTLNKIENITENKNISITYEKNLYKVIVKHYLKDTTTSVFGDDLLTGHLNTPYKAEPKTDYLYSVVSENGKYVLPDNVEGFFEEDIQTVIIYYVENEVDLKVNYYIDGTDTELAPSSIQRKTLGSTYQTVPLDIDFYDLTRTIGNESGTLTRDLTEVTYMYQQNNESTITIRHVDKATGEDLVTPITKTVTRHDTYTTDDPVTIPAKYRLTETPINASGPAEDANIEVIYYYEEIPFNVSVDKKINSILLNGEKQTITDSKNVTISPAKKDNLIVYYEIILKNTGDIKANFTVVEGDIPGFEIYDKGNFTKTNNGYELVAELEPGEEKEYRIGYKWNQKDYGISTNKVELKEVTNDKGFDEPDALDNISTATIETKIPKGVLDDQTIIPNTLDNIPAMIMLLITSIVGIITSLILIRKRRMN